MPTNQEQLDALKAKFPKNRAHDIQAAFDLGQNDLDAKLAHKPRPAGTSPGALPPLPKSLLYHGLLIKAQSFQIPVHRYDLQRDEKHRMGMIQTQTDANLAFILSILPKHLKIGNLDRDMTNAQATLEYFDNYTTVIWEALDAVLSCADPVKAVAILRLLETEGMDAIQLASDPEPETLLHVA